jgi:hypothetical protein
MINFHSSLWLNKILLYKNTTFSESIHELQGLAIVNNAAINMGV